MDLLPSDEQTEIIGAVSDFLSKELPGARQRALWTETTSWDADFWTQCAELGWFGLALPESDGGVGYSLAEEALLFREIGRHLGPGPFLSTVLGARLAVAAGQEDLAGTIVTGQTVVGLAQPRSPQNQIGSRVSGPFTLLDAEGAQYVLAVSPAGAALIATGAFGAIERQPCLDPSVRLGVAALDDVAAEAYISAATEPLLLRGSVLVAAMAAGICEATLDLSTEHAKVRVQFGKPIGVNQAVKHRCADMAIQAAAARWQSMLAALSLESGRLDAPFQATSAKIVAVNAAIKNSRACIQLHGGVGYTLEHDANRYLKRAHVLDQYLGASREQLARLIELSPDE